MGWVIALAVLLGLGFVPLGVRVIYQKSGAAANLLLGPIKVALYPGKKKQEPKQEANISKTEKKAAAPKAEKEGGSLKDFLPILRLLSDFLGDLRRKLRIKRLEFLLNMAGDDPCDLAVNYGKAWAAVGNLMPQLERLFVIQKRDVQVCCDFEGTQTALYLRADITITLGRLLGLGVRYGWRVLKQYLKINDNKKGGAVK